MIKKSLLFGAVALAAVAPLTAQEAESTAEASPAAVSPAIEAVVKHVSSLLDSSWKSTFAIQAFEGEKSVMEASVAVKFMDTKHFRLDIAMTTEDEFEGSVEQTFTVVADGSYIYLDTPQMAKLSRGMFSGPLKVELGFAESTIASQTGVDIKDGNALKGLVAEGISSLGLKEDGSVEGQRRFVLEKDGTTGSVIFDAKTWFLVSGEMKGEDGTGTVVASDTGKVNEWPEGTFTFAAAEGVVVTDLTSILKGQMEAMGGSVEDDEDLEF